jgi:hypothetical protein
MSVYAVSISFRSAVAFGPEFYMAHKPARAFQQALGIGKLRATKESDINVSLEPIEYPGKHESLQHCQAHEGFYECFGGASRGDWIRWFGVGGCCISAHPS